LQRQLLTSEQAAELRTEADLMLAYLHTAKRGQTSMTVPLVDGGQRDIELDPSKTVQAQAKARYERARRLEDGRPIARQRLQ
jgi:predicted ribosome quality control (RQC) complex YloA/Tae2 family protein